MDGTRDLELILRSRTPIIVIESRDEARILELLQSIAVRSASDTYTPLFRWTITDRLQRIDIELEPQAINSEPTGVLKHIRAVKKSGIYVLLDLHPFLDDPVHIRLLKDICMKYCDIARQIVLDGFSGAEIEQAVVAALYSAHAKKQPLATKHIQAEVAQTKPLSVVMAERISVMRDWAAERTVLCD